MKATKKPVEIDYLPYKGDITSVKEWVHDIEDNFDDHFIADSSIPFHGSLFVKTLEGTSYEVTTNDVIIRGTHKEYYPCKKNIFQDTYDILPS